MFKKKPTVKPAAPLRSSDRRKLASSIITDFSITYTPTPPTVPTPEEAAAAQEPESSTSAAANANNAPDPALTALRNTLLPESTVSAKFTTTLGPDLHPVNGIIYSGSHATPKILSDGKSRPLWVKTDDHWFPTVYTCWEAVEYGVLPLVYTHAGVMEKVYGGADLMMPGVIGVNRVEGVKKGTVVGVADYKRENVVLAVGVAETDIGSDGGRGGEKGKGVRVVHWVGDELWGLGGEGVDAPEELEVGTEVQEEGGVSLEGLKIDDVPEKAVEAPKEEESEEEVQFPEMTTMEIDNAFRDALIYSLYNVLTSPDRSANAHHSLNFPIPSSAVLANMIIPKLPNLQNPNYTIQKTSWKKIQKMLKQMDKEDLLKIKERGGDVVVYAVNWESNRISSFTPYPIVTPKPKKKPVEESPAGPSSNGGAGTVKVVELYKAPAKLNVIYEATATSTKGFYTASQARDTLYNYFQKPTPNDPSETLVSSTNARMITLNPVLANLLLDDTKSPADARLLKAGAATRDLLAERFIKLHQQYYTIISPSGEESKPKSGTPPKVVITLESRQGKKTVTRVKGMEVFGVNVGKFMDELKSVAASSVTKGPIEGGGKAAEGMVEVMVQGDKTADVEKILLKAGIRKADIVLDNKLKKKK